MSVLVSVGKNLATWLGVGFVSLLAMECTLRVYNPVDLPLRGTNIVLPAKKHVIFENPIENSKIDPIIEVTYNSIGFRGPDPPVDFDAHLTLFTVGGSTTRSARQGNELDWTSHLRRALDSEFDNVWVNNAGLEGHSTFGHAYLVEQFLTKLGPDMLIFLIGVNDRGREEERAYDFQHRPDQSFLRGLVVKSELLSTAVVVWRSGRARRAGLHHWEFELGELPRMDTTQENVEETLAEHRGRFASLYRQRVLGLIRMCREAGIEPAFLTQPSLLGSGIDPHTGLAIGDVESGKYSAGLAWQVLDVYNDVLRELAVSERVLLIDLGGDMPKDSSLFYDWFHFTNRGSEVVAEVVAPLLIDHLRKNPKAVARSTD